MKLLLTALIAAVTVAAPAAAQPVADHLACYKIKDSQAKATYTATVDGLVVQAGCTIKVPAAMACAPASKTNVTPAPPSGGGIGRPNGFTCYKVKCAKATLAPVTVTDQFGSRSVTPSKMQLVCAPNAGPTDGGFPATGQTTCWNSSGTVIACAGTGQDGDTHTGAPLAYTDNGDGTITDNNTGLMWEKQSNGDDSIHDMNTAYTWDQAFSVHVATLNSTSFAGHTDWRVPNYKELVSIVDLGNHAPAVLPAFNNNCMSPCTVLTCSCTQANRQWSSNSLFSYPLTAWYVNFSDGTVDVYDKRYVSYVRAVRGGS